MEIKSRELQELCFKEIDISDIEEIRLWKNSYSKYFFNSSEISAKEQREWFSKIYLGDKNNFIFIIYYKSGNDLSVAIPPLIIATIVAVVVVYFIEKKIPFVPLIGGIVISLFGGLTLYFNNPIFLYMKPTIINIIFGIILIFGKIFFNRNFLKFFFKTAFQLDEMGWNKLNFRWAYFLSF